MLFAGPRLCRTGRRRQAGHSWAAATRRAGPGRRRAWIGRGVLIRLQPFGNLQSPRPDRRRPTRLNATSRWRSLPAGDPYPRRAGQFSASDFFIDRPRPWTARSTNCRSHTRPASPISMALSRLRVVFGSASSSQSRSAARGSRTSSHRLHQIRYRLRRGSDLAELLEGRHPLLPGEPRQDFHHFAILLGIGLGRLVEQRQHGLGLAQRHQREACHQPLVDVLCLQHRFQRRDQIGRPRRPAIAGDCPCRHSIPSARRWTRPPAGS